MVLVTINLVPVTCGLYDTNRRDIGIPRVGVESSKVQDKRTVLHFASPKTRTVRGMTLYVHGKPWVSKDFELNPRVGPTDILEVDVHLPDSVLRWLT